MSERVYVEKQGVPWWAWAIGVGGVVAGGAYLAYRYFVYPGDVLIEQYKKILEDIYDETRDFLYDNAALPTPIYGLTTGQEAMIAAKKDALQDLEPKVMELIEQRGQSIEDVLYALIVGVVVAVAAAPVLKVLLDFFRDWKLQKPGASKNMNSAHAHSHLMFEFIANEFAALGQLSIASGFYYGTIPHFYDTYTSASLGYNISYYQSIIPQLTGIQLLVAQQMLMFMTYEISVVTGIMTVMQPFWLPPLI